MKKILSILTVLCICGISAFAQNTAPKENIMKDKKVLVAFFSRTGENYNVGNISKSNTHIIAEMIAGETNGKLFQIEPVKPYPDEYRACVDIAKTEKENKARPAVKEDIAAEDYDVIFLGYPNWWGDMPMAVYTFIGMGRPSSRSARTRAADCPARSVFWNKPARARPLPKVSQFKELPPRTRRPRQKRPCSPG